MLAGTADDMMLGAPRTGSDLLQESGALAVTTFAGAFTWNFFGGVVHRWWRWRAALRSRTTSGPQHPARQIRGAPF